MSFPERRGLGRGLGAIIRDASSGDPLLVASTDAATTGRAIDRHLIARLAEVGLDLLEVYEPSHLGYLHQVMGEPPQLMLRRPCLERLEPTDAYRLLASLDRATQDLEHTRYNELDGTALMFVPSRGPHSTGVHMVGHQLNDSPTERLTVEETCRAVAQVVHQIHREIEPDDDMQISTDVGDDRVRAHAVVHDTSGHATEGEAEAPDVATAITRALVRAHGNGLAHRVTQALEMDGGQQAVLTVLADDDGVPRLGFTVGDAPAEQIAVSAARRAIRG